MIRKLTAAEVEAIRSARRRETFARVPAGRSRRGAIATQRVHVYGKPRTIEGYVTLPQLAAERGIQAQLARLWLKKAKVPKPAGGWWAWKEGSRELKHVRTALWADI